jgi:hypothetical protein
MKKSKRKGIWIPVFILEDQRLDAANKIIMAEVSSLSKLKKGCYASDEHFVSLVGINRSSVNKRINKLEKLGYFSKKTKKGKGKYLILLEQGKSVESVPEVSSGSSFEVEIAVPKGIFTISQENTINTATNTDILKQDLIEKSVDISLSVVSNSIPSGPITQAQFARNKIALLENQILQAVSTGAEIIHNAKYLNEKTLWEYVDNRIEYGIVLPLLRELKQLKRQLGR